MKNTIKENREFKRMYAKAKSAVTPCMVVYCRLGVTVSTKLGGAVVRNRARRRLREVFRLAQPGMKQGWDMILVARARAVDGPWKKLTAAFDRACRELGVLEEQG